MRATKPLRAVIIRTGIYTSKGNAVRAGRYLAIALTFWAIAFAQTGGPVLAAGADAAYTVASYPVEATAGNAVEAKQQALADGQQALCSVDFGEQAVMCSLVDNSWRVVDVSH